MIFLMFFLHFRKDATGNRRMQSFYRDVVHLQVVPFVFALFTYVMILFPSILALFIYFDISSCYSFNFYFSTIDQRTWPQHCFLSANACDVQR